MFFPKMSYAYSTMSKRVVYTFGQDSPRARRVRRELRERQRPGAADVAFGLVQQHRDDLTAREVGRELQRVMQDVQCWTNFTWRRQLFHSPGAKPLEDCMPCAAYPTQKREWAASDGFTKTYFAPSAAGVFGRRTSTCCAAGCSSSSSTWIPASVRAAAARTRGSSSPRPIARAG